MLLAFVGYLDSFVSCPDVIMVVGREGVSGRTGCGGPAYTSGSKPQDVCTNRKRRPKTVSAYSRFTVEELAVCPDLPLSAQGDKNSEIHLSLDSGTGLVKKGL